MDVAGHQNDLLAAGRCGQCAERVPRVLIVRAADCPHCESGLTWSGGAVLDALESRQALWRIVGYSCVAAASFIAGAVPLMQVGVQVLAILILHVIVLRRSLLWLPPGRRILARLTIKLVGAAVAVLALLINVACAPLVGVSALVLAATGPLLTAAYIEGGLAIVRQRLRWEAEKRPLSIIEWGLPAAILAALLLATVATAGIALGMLHLIASAEIPSISEIAARLAELSQ